MRVFDLDDYEKAMEQIRSELIEAIINLSFEDGLGHMAKLLQIDLEEDYARSKAESDEKIIKLIINDVFDMKGQCLTNDTLVEAFLNEHYIADYNELDSWLEYHESYTGWIDQDDISHYWQTEINNHHPELCVDALRPYVDWNQYAQDKVQHTLELTTVSPVGTFCGF